MSRPPSLYHRACFALTLPLSFPQPPSFRPLLCNDGMANAHSLESIYPSTPLVSI